MAKRRQTAGIYQKRGRYYLSWYVQGAGPQHAALIPPGQTQATDDPTIARVLAEEVRNSGLTAKQLAGIRKSANGNGHDRPRKRPGPKKTSADLPIAPALAKLVEEFRRYNTNTSAKPKHAETNVSKIRFFLHDAKIEDVTAITTAAISRYLDAQQAKGLSAGTRNRTCAALRAFGRFLTEREYLKANPAREVRTPKVKLPAPRFLSQAEYDKTLKLAKANGIEVEVTTALYTGMRRAELRAMEWSAVDWAGKKIVLLETKTDNPRSIPMKQALIDTLTAHAKATTGHERPATGYVFPDAKGKIRKLYWWRYALDPLREALPIFDTIKGCGQAWHLFRHTFCSRLVQAGVPLRKVAEWAGHTSIATTMRYAHLQPSYDEQIEKA